MIKAFARKLMDHVVNDTKTPRNVVDKAYTEWQISRETQLNLESELDDYFITNVIAPMRERESQYDEYLMEKTRLWGNYLAAHGSSKHEAMLAYVTHPIPEILQEIDENVPVYTKNVCLQ
jgi:uncharacterized protein (UPF0147 family)